MLFRVMRPTDPPGWQASLEALVRLRDDGMLTPEEFEAKKTELLGLAEGVAYFPADGIGLPPTAPGGATPTLDT